MCRKEDKKKVSDSIYIYIYMYKKRGHKGGSVERHKHLTSTLIPRFNGFLTHRTKSGADFNEQTLPPLSPLNRSFSLLLPVILVMLNQYATMLPS